MTVTDGHSSDSDILGRSDVNDVDAILEICAANTDVDEVEHLVADNSDAMFTWNYEKGERPKLEKLYEKAKTSQWNAEVDLDWSIDVDPYEAFSIMGELGPETGWTTEPDSPIYGWGDKEMREFSYESFSWRLSQFLHGEQGALLCTAKIVETVPFYDAKLYASTQVMDEARHVEVFAKYLDTKLENSYPVNAHLRLLLDDIINDSRWDMTYLGMQIMVEGLALAAFGSMHKNTEEPLLKNLLRYVMSDEARHVAFGVLSLQEYYQELSQPEIRERQEFAYEAAVRMRDRFLQQEVWDRLGVDVRQMMGLLLSHQPEENVFQQLLFSKIVPNCKKLGLLDAGDGWLRTKFTEMGIIEYEDWVTTDDEYGAFDEVQRDRDAG